jgi:hypothetical protein
MAQPIMPQQHHDAVSSTTARQPGVVAPAGGARQCTLRSTHRTHSATVASVTHLGVCVTHKAQGIVPEQHVVSIQRHNDAVKVAADVADGSDVR